MLIDRDWCLPSAGCTSVRLTLSRPLQVPLRFGQQARTATQRFAADDPATAAETIAEAARQRQAPLGQQAHALAPAPGTPSDSHSAR